jgi:hypothetical protein
MHFWTRYGGNVRVLAAIRSTAPPGRRDLVHRIMEDRFIRLRRFRETADLVDELQRRRMRLGIGGRRLDVEAGTDVAALGVMLLIVQPG